MEFKIPGDFTYVSSIYSFAVIVRLPGCVPAAGKFFEIVIKSLKSKDLQTCHGLSCNGP